MAIDLDGQAFAEHRQGPTMPFRSMVDVSYAVPPLLREITPFPFLATVLSHGRVRYGCRSSARCPAYERRSHYLGSFNCDSA